MPDVLDELFRFSQVFRSYPLCHSRPDRAFCYRGRYFGLCARCTAMYLGGLLTLVSASVWRPSLAPNVVTALGLLLMVPGGVDGTTQMFWNRESTNALRAITGLLLGVGVVLFLHGVTLLALNAVA